MGGFKKHWDPLYEAAGTTHGASETINKKRLFKWTTIIKSNNQLNKSQETWGRQ